MMAIITSKKEKDNSSIKVKLNLVILEQIENYCQWAGIYDLGYFFEKAANELFSKDDEWTMHQKQIEREKID